MVELKYVMNRLKGKRHYMSYIHTHKHPCFISVGSFNFLEGDLGPREGPSLGPKSF